MVRPAVSLRLLRPRTEWPLGEAHCAPPAGTAPQRVQSASEPSAPQPRRSHRGHPRPSLRPDPHTRRPPPECPPRKLRAKSARRARPIQTKTVVQNLALSAAIGPDGAAGDQWEE